MRADAAVPFTRRDAAACGLVVCLGALVYLNALHNPFVYDDVRTVVANNPIRHPGNLHDLLMRDATRPMMSVSYAIDYAIWRGASFGYHLTNLLLHLLNVVVLYRLARLLHGDRSRFAGGPGGTVAAVVAAGLLAVHPLMTEAVGYVSGRSEVLCATWVLLAVLAGRRWMRDRGLGWWALTMALWMAGLLTKEVAAVVPLLLLSYDRLILGGDSAEWRARLRRLHAPMILAAAGAGAARLGILLFVEHPPDLLLSWRSVAAEAEVVARYLGLLVYPAGQAIFHQADPPSSLVSVRTLTGVLPVVAIVAVAWLGRRRAAVASFGIFWFFLALAPSSLLAAAGLGEAMAEHRVYVAACGFFLTAGAIAAWAQRQLARVTTTAAWLPYVAAAAVLLPLGSRTVLRNEVWASPVALWQEAAARSPRSGFPLVVLGESLHDAGRHQEAVTAYTRAIALDPDDELAYLKLGLCLSELGRFHDAAVVFEDLARRKPGSTVVSTGQGMVALLSGDSAKGRRFFLTTLQHDHQDLMARQWLAVLEEEAGHPAEAARWCEEALTLMPGDVTTIECIRRNRAAGGPGR